MANCIRRLNKAAGRKLTDNEIEALYARFAKAKSELASTFTDETELKNAAATLASKQLMDEANAVQTKANEAIAKQAIKSRVFNQSGSSEPIASFNPEQLLIGLTKASNLSSFHHEAGHFFLEATNRLALIESAPESIKADMQKTLDWLGVKDIQTWNKMSLEEQRPYHEQFAKGYEAYLFEGKAPSLETASMFQRFKAWMMQTYQSLKDLGVELNPEIRGVYDRLLATDAQIKQAEEARNMFPLFPDAVKAGMSPEDFSDYETLSKEASNKSSAELGQKALDDMKWLEGAKSKALKAIQKSVADIRKGVRSEVATQVANEPVYIAQRLIKENKGIEGNLDIVADQAGFKAVEEMGEALKNARPLKEEIVFRTDQRMLEEHGQTLEDMQNAADEDRKSV